MAGFPAPPEMLVDVSRLEKEYYTRQPDLDDSNQLVSFGTSGHRGCSFRGSFNEAHILAIAQAICDYRRGEAVDGPLEEVADGTILIEIDFGRNASGIASQPDLLHVTSRPVGPRVSKESAPPLP